MTTVYSLDSLKNFLSIDAQRTSINPVRFISVDSMEMWIEVKKILLSMADETLLLSKYCVGEDTTPNISRVGSALKKVKNSQFISPLSEYLRIIPEQAETVVERFIKADYQNNETGRLRLYFLMYRMKSLLRTINTDDPRTKDCIVLFETDEESDYKLTIIQKDIDVRLPGNEVYGFRSYLEHWEANPDRPLILHTENAIHFEKNHFFDDVHVIVSSYDLIKYQYGLPVSVYEELGSSDEWNGLLKEIIKEGSFDGACCSVLRINRYSKDLFERWSQLSAFQKWTLWLWARLQSVKGYEIEAAKECTDSKSYLDSLYCYIINYVSDIRYEQYYEERKKILSMMQSVPTNLFWSKISSLSRIEALKCLTCLTDIEQKTVFEVLGEFDYDHRGPVLSVLKRVYPQLYYYLHNDVHPNSAGLSADQDKYFSEYKWLKATNKITTGFIEKVSQIALEKGASVFQMRTRNQCVAENYDDKTLILFVDGMGVEYADYLAYLFMNLDSQQYSVNIEAGFCTLPSTTENNKDFMNGRKTVEPPVRELDELKHANNVHPESLVKQLHILDNLKNRVLGLLIGSTRRIIIASDHGTSRLAVMVRGSEYDNVYAKPSCQIYKYGRFCEGIEDEPNYPTAICYNDCLVFADYSRFVQSGAPIDEIHGGASLEEWIVPVVSVERVIANSEVRVEVLPVKKRYRPELGTKLIKVLFTISGEERSHLFARVSGNTYECEKGIDGYSFSFAPAKDDRKLNVKIVDHGVLGQFDIEIEQGIGKNTNFDI